MRIIHSLQVGQPFNPWKLFQSVSIPLVVVESQKLSPGAKLCLGVLWRFGGDRNESWPAIATVAKRMGMSRDQVKRYIRELEVEKYIRRDPKSGRANHYLFLWHETFEAALALRRNVHRSK